MVKLNEEGVFELDVADPDQWMILVPPANVPGLPKILSWMMNMDKDAMIVVGVVNDPQSAQPYLETFRPIPFGLIAEVMKLVHDHKVEMN